jgi:hypothetical protein
MVRWFALFSLAAGVGFVPASLGAARPQVPASCLHGSSERPVQEARREQALALAQQLNRAENAGPAVLPEPGRIYRPLDQLENVPATPAGFTLQFYTDGSTYSFSLLDTRDACHYAIFSNQNQWVYEATPRATGVRVLPLENP